MENNIINTLLDHERVTSTYADVYFNDDYCKGKLPLNVNITTHESPLLKDIYMEWTSPSDLLIGKVELNPPFTSKITRGKTHEGILAIGNEVLDKEHKRFLASLDCMLHENDESWNHILINEKKLIAKRVTEVFEDIFQQKCIIMNKEITKFYESTLQDLESHLQSEVINVLSSTHANMISALNIEISSRLKKERTILECVLKKKYNTEVNKMITYYKLLLTNETYKHNKLINCALSDRNDALNAFCRQIDAERLTSSMYIMSIERKKCKIKKMHLETFQSSELTEKLTKIKQKQDVIETFKLKEQTISYINKQWEGKMKKILELFLKFVSFSLKLLPEQSTFLLDFQKMVVLQLNEIKRQPYLKAPSQSILMDVDNLANIFRFETSDTEEQICEHKPFTLIGDLSDPIPPRYGSSETLPSNVDLPFIRVNRQYVYAKCHGYEDLKKLLESQECRCAQQPSQTCSQELTNQTTIQTEIVTAKSSDTKSSTETLLFDDVLRLEECPSRKCGNWTERNLFPFLPTYLDYTEKNFERVKAILSESPSKDKAPEPVRAKTIAYSELPFAETKEKYRHAETQYSTQEFEITNFNCTCINNHNLEKDNLNNESSSQILTDVLTKRKASLRRLLYQHPNLFKVFTDENFDFQL